MTFCTNCGKALSPDDKFCAGCGQAVTTEAEPAAPPAMGTTSTTVAGSPIPTPPVVTPTAASARQASPKPRWKKKRYWIPAVVIAAILIIPAVVPSKKKRPSATHTASTPAVVVPKGVSEARSYIQDRGRDINLVHALVQSVQIGVALAQKTPTQSTIDELAQLAQQAHDSLDNIRNNFASTNTESGSVANAELEVFGAANDLKNSMGALVAYTGDPNPATLAHFTSQYQTAVSEWNDGIRTIWRAAHRPRPPVL